MSLRPSKIRHKNTDHAGFSLLELLIVMSVISMLVALTTLSFQTSSAQGLTTSGNQMMEAATFARQNSLTRHTYTAIVIKTRNSGAYSAYCLLQLTRNDDGSFGGWSTLLPWRNLRNGFVFSPSAPVSQSSTNFFANSGSMPVPLPSQYSNATAQIYEPDGTLSAGTALFLRMAEGTSNSSGTGVVLSRTNSSGTPANYYDIIFLRDTGETVAERL